MLKPIILTTVALFSFASLADSDQPACRGNEISKELRGAYEQVTQNGNVLGLELLEHDIRVKLPNKFELHPAWTCVEDGVLILVSEYDAAQPQDRSYESRIILTSGDNIVDVGEIDGSADFPSVPGERMSEKLIKFLNHSPLDFGLLRRKK
jgi:hypothetical protein